MMSPADRTTSIGAILVTGANGFVGKHALLALRTAFPDTRLIAGVQRSGSECPGADITVAFDLLDATSVEKAIETTQPDAVLHLAAQAAVPTSFIDPLATWRVNLLGTLTLAEALLRHAPLALFVHASSAEVYGLSFRSGHALNEDAPFAPANPYAASKAAADIALGEMALRGLRAVRMRPFNQVGQGQTDAFVLAAFAKQVAQIEAGFQEPVIRTGALNRWRDFIDVRDIVRAYVSVIARGSSIAPGTAINLASGAPRLVYDILDELIRLSGTVARIETDPGRLRPTDLERVQGDTSRAISLLGWTPLIPWECTLNDILDGWRARIRQPSG